MIFNGDVEFDEGSHTFTKMLEILESYNTHKLIVENVQELRIIEDD